MGAWRRLFWAIGVLAAAEVSGQCVADSHGHHAVVVRVTASVAETGIFGWDSLAGAVTNIQHVSYSLGSADSPDSSNLRSLINDTRLCCDGIGSSAQFVFALDSPSVAVAALRTALNEAMWPLTSEYISSTCLSKLQDVFAGNLRAASPGERALTAWLLAANEDAGIVDNGETVVSLAADLLSVSHAPAEPVQTHATIASLAGSQSAVENVASFALGGQTAYGRSVAIRNGQPHPCLTTDSSYTPPSGGTSINVQAGPDSADCKALVQQVVAEATTAGLGPASAGGTEGVATGEAASALQALGGGAAKMDMVQLDAKLTGLLNGSISTSSDDVGTTSPLGWRAGLLLNAAQSAGLSTIRALPLPADSATRGAVLAIKEGGVEAGIVPGTFDGLEYVAVAAVGASVVDVAVFNYSTEEFELPLSLNGAASGTTLGAAVDAVIGGIPVNSRTAVPLYVHVKAGASSPASVADAKSAAHATDLLFKDQFLIPTGSADEMAMEWAAANQASLGSTVPLLEVAASLTHGNMAFQTTDAILADHVVVTPYQGGVSTTLDLYAPPASTAADIDAAFDAFMAVHASATVACLASNYTYTSGTTSVSISAADYNASECALQIDAAASAQASSTCSSLSCLSSLAADSAVYRPSVPGTGTSVLLGPLFAQSILDISPSQPRPGIVSRSELDGILVGPPPATPARPLAAFTAHLLARFADAAGSTSLVLPSQASAGTTWLAGAAVLDLQRRLQYDSASLAEPAPTLLSLTATAPAFSVQAPGDAVELVANFSSQVAGLAAGHFSLALASGNCDVTGSGLQYAFTAMAGGQQRIRISGLTSGNCVINVTLSSGGSDTVLPIHSVMSGGAVIVSVVSSVVLDSTPPAVRRACVVPATTAASDAFVFEGDEAIFTLEFSEAVSLAQAIVGGIPYGSAFVTASSVDQLTHTVRIRAGAHSDSLPAGGVLPSVTGYTDLAGNPGAASNGNVTACPVDDVLVRLWQQGGFNETGLTYVTATPTYATNGSTIDNPTTHDCTREWVNQAGHEDAGLSLTETCALAIEGGMCFFYTTCGGTISAGEAGVQTLDLAAVLSPSPLPSPVAQSSPRPVGAINSTATMRVTFATALSSGQKAQIRGALFRLKVEEELSSGGFLGPSLGPGSTVTVSVDSIGSSKKMKAGGPRGRKTAGSVVTMSVHLVSQTPETDANVRQQLYDMNPQVFMVQLNQTLASAFTGSIALPNLNAVTVDVTPPPASAPTSPTVGSSSDDDDDDLSDAEVAAIVLLTLMGVILLGAGGYYFGVHNRLVKDVPQPGPQKLGSERSKVNAGLDDAQM